MLSCIDRPLWVKGPPFLGACSLTLIIIGGKKRKCKCSALFGVTKAYTLGKPRRFPNFNTYLREHNQSQMCSSKKIHFTLLKCFSPLFFFVLKTTPGQWLPATVVAKYRFIEWLKLLVFRHQLMGLKRAHINGVLKRSISMVVASLF